MTTYPLTEGRRVEGGFAIYPNSLLFKAGEYADKGITVTEDELKAAAAKFAPLEFNSEHDTHGVHKAVLSGIGKHFGGMGGPRKVWIDAAAPDTLRGEVAVPLWLDDELVTKSLSMEIDKATKMFVGAGLTYTPRVSEAALMSACVNFAMTRHNTPEGQTALQDVHDMAARSGAVCDRKNVNMASQHEATAMQKIHDMAADHGAACKSGEKPSYYSRLMDSKGAPMLDKLKALFSKAGVPDADIDAHLQDAVAELTPAAGMSAAEKALFTAQASEIAALREKDNAREAEVFFSTLLTEGRALPYERPLILAQFAQAAKDDAQAGGTVKFSAIDQDLKPVVKDGTRVESLRALLSVRPSSGLTSELLSSGRPVTQGDLTALFSRQGAGETEDEKKARIKAEANEERLALGLPVKP